MPERRSIRLPFYDYGSAGGFFVTINTHKRLPTFGKLRSGEVELNWIGRIAEEKWVQLPEHFPQVSLDAYIVMPTHMHGILFITEDDIEQAKSHVRATHASPIQKARGPKLGSLGAIIGSYKSAVTKAVNQLRSTPGQSVWHRNYYERVIRNQKELDEIRHYIENNAIKENPA